MKACSNIRAVVFDLDGTLLDTVPDLGESANAALRRFGMPAMPARDYQPRIGHGIRNLMLQSVPEGTPEALFEQVLAFYLAYYPEHCTEHTQIYPGVAELLEKLQGAGYALAVLSNKTERTAQRIISHFFPQTPFRFVWGNNGVRPLKPAPDAGEALCRELGLMPEEIMYVGDGDSDMEFASKVGFFGTGVTWGYRSRKQLAENGADALMDSAEEITRLLNA